MKHSHYAMIVLASAAFVTHVIAHPSKNPLKNQVNNQSIAHSIPEARSASLPQAAAGKKIFIAEAGQTEQPIVVEQNGNIKMVSPGSVNNPQQGNQPSPAENSSADESSSNVNDGPSSADDNAPSSQEGENAAPVVSPNSPTPSVMPRSMGQ